MPQQINSDGQLVEVHEGGNLNDNRFSVNLSGLTLVVTVMLMLVIGACGVVMGLNIARMDTLTETAGRAERESRMLEYYVNEVDGKLIHAGFIEPRDRWSPSKKAELERKHP